MESCLKSRDYIIHDAGDVVLQRFYDYIEKKLEKEWDTTKWEFINFLLEQAKIHKLDLSGYGSLEYQKDRDEARAIFKQGEQKQEERGSVRR